jgi:hypothetical protein
MKKCDVHVPSIHNGAFTSACSFLPVEKNNDVLKCFDYLLFDPWPPHTILSSMAEIEFFSFTQGPLVGYTCWHLEAVLANFATSNWQFVVNVRLIITSKKKKWKHIIVKQKNVKYGRLTTSCN